jgi:hypothetical protein
VLGVVTQDPAQLQDGLVHGALRHDHVGPDLIEQVLYVNDPSGMRCEIYEQPHSARLQPNRLPLARELIEVWIDPPLTNAPDL